MEVTAQKRRKSGIFFQCELEGKYSLESTDPRESEIRAPPQLTIALKPGPILSVFPALIVHSELKSVHPGFPLAFIF